MKGKKLDQLKAIMRFKNVSQKELAEVLGIGKSTFCDKVNGTRGKEFTTSEIKAIGTHLELAPDEVIQYFFPEFLRFATKTDIVRQ